LKERPTGNAIAESSALAEDGEHGDSVAERAAGRSARTVVYTFRAAVCSFSREGKGFVNLAFWVIRTQAEGDRSFRPQNPGMSLRSEGPHFLIPGQRPGFQGRSEFHIVVGDVTPSLAVGVRQKALVSGANPDRQRGGGDYQPQCETRNHPGLGSVFFTHPVDTFCGQVIPPRLLGRVPTGETTGTTTRVTQTTGLTRCPMRPLRWRR